MKVQTQPELLSDLDPVSKEKLIFKKGWRCSSNVKALGSIPITGKESASQAQGHVLGKHTLHSVYKHVTCSRELSQVRALGTSQY